MRTSVPGRMPHRSNRLCTSHTCSSCLAVALVVGLLAWLVQPRVAAAETAGDVPAAPLPLRTGERAVWLRTGTMATGAIVGITLAVVAVCIAAILSWVADGGVAAVILSALAVVVLLLAVSSTVFRVRADERGLRVASLLGVPPFQVPLTDVAAAARVTIEPMGEFGGWGMRVGPGGRFGVLLRRGEAIEVTRRSGKRFVVTVGDAGTGAALLEALRERQGTAAD
ncbi:hypothetical protein [Microbacterium caowuchunii]|uniref:DUF1648 domain-containing protein n=1 Tax=Microbacterium caowuchunii TaxID=2614638 RepID=A0A5N0T822_9MICO|nr:hypothetical protein [Microbacterium caowuchunii]KAA9130644.1 hypothetical protein F6B40_13480 [Microbacterium caowuchunii]